MMHSRFHFTFRNNCSMADDCFADRTLLGFLIYVPLQRWMTIGLQVRAALPLLFTNPSPQVSV